jgi:ABC-type sugar transport system ATPase subunit
VAEIRLEGLAKVYPNGHTAVRPLELAIADGELLVLVGPSGCGKSTLLRLIAGLETPTEGRILFGGEDVTALPPQSRDLAMVFQSYALYPHMSVRENLGYGLKVRGTRREVIAERISTVAQALDLESLLDRRPAQLSGGQRQRVALGRALVRQPNAFLFDEPLSNLDPALRAQARAEIARLHRTLGSTMVYVTHDQEEAMTLGQRVAVMRGGALEQVASPREIYARPSNTFVARFIGAPPMNVVPGRIWRDDAPGGTLVGVRPHDLAIDDDGSIQAVVELVEPRGHDAVVHLRLEADSAPALLAVVEHEPPAVGSRVRVSADAGRLHLFDEATGARRG